MNLKSANITGVEDRQFDDEWGQKGDSQTGWK
jgi:hypothetical protein